MASNGIEVAKSELQTGIWYSLTAAAIVPSAMLAFIWVMEIIFTLPMVRHMA